MPVFGDDPVAPRDGACKRGGRAHDDVMNPGILSSNTVLYVARFVECVAFYRDRLGFTVSFANAWFVEMQVCGTSKLSVADQRRTSIRSAAGHGLTLTFEVADLAYVHAELARAGAAPGAMRAHGFGAQVFYLRDPEGNRIEFWSRKQV